MYDILFICKHCGLHLSADENDVGAAFPCPECAKEITIPVGDILFDCPKCGKSLLASRTAVRQSFDCPACNRQIIIPPIGKSVPVSEKTELISPPPVIAPLPVPEKPTSPPPTADIPAEADEKHFMSTWGDYLAEAGLADDKSPPPPPQP
jgi:predicted RNA-binding Zn-ribbon protein involved in translation (DUF1610 family)